jgi:hypothetical protein
VLDGSRVFLLLVTKYTAVVKLVVEKEFVFGKSWHHATYQNGSWPLPTARRRSRVILLNLGIAPSLFLFVALVTWIMADALFV